MRPSPIDRPPRPLRRRLLAAGGIAATVYAACTLLFMLMAREAGQPLRPDPRAIAGIGIGLALASGIGALLFGGLPHLLAISMERTSSLFDLLNKAALATALASVLIGVLSALALIFDIAPATKPLLVAVTLFLGAAATLCSLKFFHANRNSE